ncbi:hypothetical protein HanPI659440_Chr08g0291751 [Helianthus annuus]|nr:hypothetical protein HanPI659440_Chr08g0291751 [Helianthus annuus]
MADLNNQQPRTVAGGTGTLNDHPGSPLNVVPHNLLPDFASNEDEDAFGESRVVEDTELISPEFPGIHADEEFYVHYTPNGTRMWCPNIPIVLKPVVGCVYETWKDVLSMYKDYDQEMEGVCHSPVHKVY